jgi:dihydroorotate dehydrogenase (NAD+) catalytic subunit
MADLRVELSGWELDNPVIAASGTFGYGGDYLDFFDPNILGTFSFKGTTREARYGNDTPRIAECPGGMLNSVGLQNPGIDSVINNELKKLGEFYHKKVIANISGFSIEDYVYSCERISREEKVGIVEVNISCPNVHNGGMAFGTTASGAAEVTRAVRKVVKKPLYMKLSPNVSDITEIAAACEAEGADGISMINTLLGMRVDIYKKRPVLANITGGISGGAILPLSLRMVWQTYERIKIPIIGMGGISNAEEAVEMMLCGATAIQVGAANLVNPYAMKEIIEGLDEILDKMKVQSIKEIIGGAHG